LVELDKQYKSRISALNKSIVEKDKKISKLSSFISQLKNKKRDIRKSAKHKYKDLKDIIFIKDLKIIAFNNQIIFFNPNARRDEIIKSSSFIFFHNAKY